MGKVVVTTADALPLLLLASATSSRGSNGSHPTRDTERGDRARGDVVPALAWAVGDGTAAVVAARLAGAGATVASRVSGTDTAVVLICGVLTLPETLSGAAAPP